MNASPLPFSHKRITIFAGHYGSGKTTLAINYALHLRALNAGINLTVCDLDIVNPYYRAADGAAVLQANHIKLIASELANTNVEAPGIPPQAKALFDDKALYAVIDAGGDERGALALGRYAGLINAENDYEMLMVINQYRPLTRDVQSLAELKLEIEAAAGIPFTGIVNNSHLGKQTIPDDVTGSFAYARAAAAALSLELKMTAVFSTVTEGHEEAFNASGMNLFEMGFNPCKV